MSQLYENTIGIDVSKATLDCAIAQGGVIKETFRIANDKCAIQQLVRKLEKQNIDKKKTIFCFENTGLYNHNLAYELSKHQANIWIENALAIKRSSGLTRGKNDKIDAQRISLYASRFQDKAIIWKPKRTVILKLESLFRARSMAIKNMTQIEKQIKITQEAESAAVGMGNAFLRPIITKIKQQLKKIERSIKALYTSDQKLKAQVAQATSVPGIGPQIALALICNTNEFQEKSTRKKLACHAGVAPFAHVSGTSVRGYNGVSHYANKKLKQILHMGALSAITRTGELQEYDQRKVAEGKAKMLVINNVRNKMIARPCACIRNGSTCEKNHVRKVA